MNMGTWPSRLRESWIWDSKIWLCVQRVLTLKMTALTRSSSSCKRHAHPLVREDVPHQQTLNYLTVIKIWSWTQDGGLTPGQTGRLTIGRKVTMTLTWETDRPIRSQLVESRQFEQSVNGREHWSWGIYIYGTRNQETALEDKLSKLYVLYSEKYSAWITETYNYL
jgi:hypothetical protein